MFIRAFAMLVLVAESATTASAEANDDAVPTSVRTNDDTGKEILSARERELLNRANMQKGEERFGIYAELVELFRDDEKALYYIDLMETAARDTKSQANVSEARFQRARYYYNNYYADEFLEYAARTKDYLALHNIARYIDMEIMTIRQLLKKGLNETALQTSRKLLERAETKDSAYWEAYAYFGIGIVYAAGKHYDKAIEAFERCYALTDSPKLKLDVGLDLISNTYNNRDYSASLRYCGVSRELLRGYIAAGTAEENRESGLLHIRMYIHCCFAMNLVRMGDVAEAAEYLRKAKSDISPYAGLDNQFYNQAAAMYYEAVGDYALALRHANMMAEAFSGNDILNYLEALEIEARVLARIGRHAEAYANMEYIKEKRDSLDSDQLAVQLSEFHALYELDKLEKERQRQRHLTVLAGSICLFLAVIVCIYVLYTRNLNRKNVALYRQMRESLNSGKERMMPSGPSRERRLFIEACELMKDEEVFTDVSFGRQTLVKQLNTNDKYLADAIHESTGLTVAKFISDHRLSYSLRLLAENPEISMEEVALKSGHGSYSSFLRAFSKKYGMSPSDYRKLSKKDRNANQRV